MQDELKAVKPRLLPLPRFGLTINHMFSSKDDFLPLAPFTGLKTVNTQKARSFRVIVIPKRGRKERLVPCHIQIVG